MSEPKIYLRKIKSEDISEKVMAWFADESLMRYYTNSKQTITRENLLAYIEDGQNSGTSFTYGIFDRINNILIGTIKLGPINLTHRIADLVVLIGDRNYHGKGLAIEAIQMGNSLAFDTYDIRKLFGGMYASNTQSIKAYLRSGWVVEGIRKGHYWNNNKNEDRIEVACFNPRYFTSQEIQEATIMTLDQALNRFHNEN